MTNTTGTVLRGDLNTVVAEASAADSFFIADKIFTPYGVSTKNGQYPKLVKASGELLRPATTVRKPKSAYGTITREWTSDTYYCLDRGLQEYVDKTEQLDQARFFDLEAMTAKLVMRNVKMAHEVQCASTLMATGTFTDYTNSAVAYTYGNLTTINFPYDVLAAIERVNANGNTANTIVLSGTVLNRLKSSTLLQNFCRGAASSDAVLNITANTIAQAFSDSGITQVLVGKSQYNSAIKGQAFSATSVWGTTYVWVGDVKTGIPEAGGAARKFFWSPDGAEWVTESWEDQERRSNVIRVRQHSVEKIIDASAGTLIVTQWS